MTQSYPVDESPYGVRGLGGNVYDWCADLVDEAAVAVSPAVDNRVVTPEFRENTASRAPRAIRGGTWGTSAGHARAAGRDRYEPGSRNPDCGFRGLFRLVLEHG